MAESTAVTRYTFYAQQAEKEKYFQYANIFNETAANELRHAKIFLQYLTEHACTPDTVGVDMGQLGSTLTNIKIAAEEEKTEGVEQYRKAADIAEAEGFVEIASKFREIAEIEAHHEARFKKMIKRIESGSVWKETKPVKWQCLVCGYIFEGTEPPEKCPACNHPYQHFQREGKNQI